MKILIALIAVLFSVAAVAETLTWTPPTTRVDGTPLDPAAELAPYELVCGEVTTTIPATGDQEQAYQVRKHRSCQATAKPGATWWPWTKMA